MESLAVASHPLQDLNRPGGSGEPPLSRVMCRFVEQTRRERKR